VLHGLVCVALIAAVGELLAGLPVAARHVGGLAITSAQAKRVGHRFHMSFATTCRRHCAHHAGQTSPRLIRG